jgi:hypothetical protein
MAARDLVLVLAVVLVLVGVRVRVRRVPVHYANTP